MKKIILVIAIALSAVYGIGRYNLGETGAMRFMSKMEASMNQGDVSEVCAMFHEDLEVEILDHSGDALHEVSGGKKEFCELTRATVAGLQMLPHAMEVEYTAVDAAQKLSRPWSSEVSYSEHRTLTIQGANVTLRTISNDRITLVQTLSGVKLRKVKSELYKEDAT
ncbi:MAG TPA: hypothetical protein VGO61_22260 [Steroidobacteraceae bacterium]|jgi:hypothetical protein|nr:hypothetical protein [Steroidobacteraceae bacterium]